MPAPVAEPQPFQEAIDFLSQKVRLPSKAWTDLCHGAHARGFVVAGAMKDELLGDFHRALIGVLKNGGTRRDFLRDFDAIVAKHGWSYKGGREWRARVIYDTNVRMAHQAGKWAQIRSLAGSLAEKGRKVYLRYSAIMDGITRPEHREWHGLILPWDHGFWRTHYPPNGWHCRCTVEVLTDRDLERRGLKPTAETDIPAIVEEPRVVDTPLGPEALKVPKGIDTGFGYNVGESWLAGAVPPALQHPLPPFGTPAPPHTLPPLPPHPVDPARILPDSLPEADYVAAFLAEFGASPGRPVGFRDVTGTALAVGEELFLAADGKSKVKKLGRHPYMLLLADALKDPDEVWVDWEDVRGVPTLRRRYVRRVDLPDKAGALTVFEWSGDGWWGTTTFAPDRDAYVERQRGGVLLYQRQ